MSNQPADSFEHALHNYNASKKINTLQDCSDWTVTSAFYASLKFLEGSLFPDEYENPNKPGDIRTYETFSQYVSAHGHLIGTNPHKIRTQLVEKHITDSEVVNSFEDLKNACHTARYINYKVGPQRLKICLEALEVIKTYCV